jgi:hypothetical protein
MPFGDTGVAKNEIGAGGAADNVNGTVQSQIDALVQAMGDAEHGCALA